MWDTLCRVGDGQSEVIDKLSSISQKMISPDSFLAGSTATLDALRQGQESIKHEVLLRALKPLSAGVRESGIARCHAETFEWIMVEPRGASAQSTTDCKFSD